MRLDETLEQVRGAYFPHSRQSSLRDAEPKAPVSLLRVTSGGSVVCGGHSLSYKERAQLRCQSQAQQHGVVRIGAEQLQKMRDVFRSYVVAEGKHEIKPSER